MKRASCGLRRASGEMLPATAASLAVWPEPQWVTMSHYHVRVRVLPGNSSGVPGRLREGRGACLTGMPDRDDCWASHRKLGGSLAFDVIMVAAAMTTWPWPSKPSTVTAA